MINRNVYLCTYIYALSASGALKIYMFARVHVPVIYCTYTYASPIVYIARIHVPQYLHVCNVNDDCDDRVGGWCRFYCGQLPNIGQILGGRAFIELKGKWGMEKI